MMSQWPFVFLLATGLYCSGEVAPPQRPYKILMLLPASSRSHRNVFMILAEALADRGHKVVMLTNHRHPIHHPNIEEIFHGVTDFYNYDVNMFDFRSSNIGILESLSGTLPNLAHEIYKLPRVKELYERRKEFDLIVISHVLNQLMYPFLHEMPFITLMTYGRDTRQTTPLENPAHPAVANRYIRKDEVTIFGRLYNGFSVALPILQWRDWSVLPVIQKEISSQFPDLPPLNELEKNQSLTLINSYLTQELFLPLQPNQITVTCMHCRPARSLPWELKSWIEGAGSAGVVYFSLGSTIKGLPPQYKKLLIEAFSKIKQRVIWVYDDELENVSVNVLVSRRFPQQDILAHPNVKAFITHGGELSIQEAFYHGIPMLVIPLHGDHQEHADYVEAKERGLALKWEELTVESLVNAINEIVYNVKYDGSMAVISQSYHDYLETPRDRAVYWTEFVIRHKGAPTLKSSAVNLSWISIYPVLDVIAFFDFLLIFPILLILIFLLFYCMVKRCFMKIGSAIKSRKQKKSKFY